MEDALSLAGLLAELGFPTDGDMVAQRIASLSSSGESVLVGVRDSEVVGLITAHVTPVLHRPTPVGRVTALVVAKRSRNCGLGRALVDAVEALLTRKGCGLIEVTSNHKLTGAHNFYLRLGYELTSLRFRKLLSQPGA